MRISDWSSDVCSSDLRDFHIGKFLAERQNDSRDQVENRGSEHANVDAADLALANRIGAVSEIGRASCRERVCQYVSLSVVAASLKKIRRRTTTIPISTTPAI